MSVLSTIKNNYIEQNTQFILLDKNGNILESDDVLFPAKVGTSIDDLHPFFISIYSTFENDTQSFTCVHLEIGKKSLICDITLKKHDDTIVIILSDFSNHYNSFQSLAQSRNETAISSELTQIENYLLTKKQEFKDKFITNFNHELVSPILSILTFSDALNKTSLNPSQSDYNKVIASSSERLKRMVDDIFDITKIETGDLDIINKRFSLQRLLNVIRQEYDAQCRAKGLDLIIDYAEDMPNYIVGDKIRIHQVLTNLLDNALKYTPSGTIKINVTPVYRRARKLTFVIKISDTGIGIPEDKHDYIFERFSRLESSKNIPGNGLGLSITKELLSLMQGDITVRSTVNNGSEFVATIRTTTPLKAISKKQLSYETGEETTKKEILLVEDHASDQLSIFKILAASKSYFIDIVNTAEEAVKLQRQKHYDIILMDYKLGTLNGLEASKIINKDKEQNTPILMLSGIKINDTILSKYDPYISDVLHKPFQPQTLLDTIKKHLK